MSDNEKMLRNYEERVNDLGYTDLQYYIAEQIKNRHPKLDMYDLYMDGENNYMDYQACPIIAGELPLSRAMEKEATLQSEKELSDITPETWNIIVATAWREYGDENLPEKLSEMKDARKAMLVEQYKDNAFLDTFIKAYNAFDYSGTIPDVYAKKFFNIVDATVKTDSSLDRMFNQLDELATEIDEKDRPDFTKIWDEEKDWIERNNMDGFVWKLDSTRATPNEELDMVTAFCDANQMDIPETGSDEWNYIVDEAVRANFDADRDNLSKTNDKGELIAFGTADRWNGKSHGFIDLGLHAPIGDAFDIMKDSGRYGYINARYGIEKDENGEYNLVSYHLHHDGTDKYTYMILPESDPDFADLLSPYEDVSSDELKKHCVSCVDEIEKVYGFDIRNFDRENEQEVR